MSEILLSQLTQVKHRVLNKDLDFWALVDGREGCGKSSFAIQIASFLDDKFNIDRVCFTFEEFSKQIREAPKNSAIVLDEGFAVGNARAAMTELNRNAMLLAAEARQRNLFIIICAPSVFDLDKYFALHRTNCLYHVYFDKSYNRGKVLFFPYSRKKLLYIYGKKLYSYARPKAQGQPISFTKELGLIKPEEYKKKKLTAFRQRDTISSMYKNWLLQRDALVMYLWNDVLTTRTKIKTLNEILKAFKSPPILSQQVYNIFNRFEDKYGTHTLNKRIARNRDSGDGNVSDKPDDRIQL